MLAAVLFVSAAACSSPSDVEDVASSTDQDLAVSTAATYFTTQWGPTSYNAAGAPAGYDDCGPTSLLMAASRFGYLPRPTPLRSEGEIENARTLTRGAYATVSGGTPTPQMLAGFAALGLPAAPIESTVSAVEDAISRGAVVILGGDPGDAWGRALDKQGHYLHRYGLGWGDVFSHWVVVFGRGVDGVTFVVGDPLSTTGPIKVSASALATYIGNSPAPATASAAGAIQVGPVKPRSQSGSIVGSAGKCVDDSGDATANDNPIQLWSCNDSDSQAWTYTGAKQLEGPGGKCLDVANGQAFEGAAVQLFACNDTAAQRWTWDGDGTVKGLGGFCLDASGGGVTDGTALQLWTCNATDAQHWTWGH